MAPQRALSSCWQIWKTVVSRSPQEGRQTVKRNLKKNDTIMSNGCHHTNITSQSSPSIPGTASQNAPGPYISLNPKLRDQSNWMVRSTAEQAALGSHHQKLCDLGQITEPFCTSSSVKGDHRTRAKWDHEGKPFSTVPGKTIHTSSFSLSSWYSVWLSWLSRHSDQGSEMGTTTPGSYMGPQAVQPALYPMSHLLSFLKYLLPGLERWLGG